MAVGATDRGTAGAGRRRADKKSAPRPKRWPVTLLLAVGIVVSGTAWAFLVRAAIDFGQTARGGQGAAWLVCGAATLGAAICLLLLFVLLARLWRHVTGGSDYQPRRSSRSH